MPEYSYVCDKEHRQWNNNTGCGHEFTIICPVSQYISSPECPECNRSDAVVRDYREDNVKAYLHPFSKRQRAQIIEPILKGSVYPPPIPLDRFLTHYQEPRP